MKTPPAAHSDSTPSPSAHAAHSVPSHAILAPAIRHRPLWLVATSLVALTAAPLLAQPASSSPPAATSTAPAPAEELIVLSPFEVTTKQDRGYRATNTLGATRINAAIKDVPMAINVATRELLDDIGAYDLRKALDYTVGVNKFAGLNTDSRFVIRGQQSDYMFRNGFNITGTFDTANVDRVEVVKGPASVLYGNAQPGGIVNYVTRRPLSAQSGSVKVLVGSDDFYRSEFDLTGPITADKNLLYRLSASAVDSGSFRRFEDQHSWFVAPVLTWQLAPGTNLTLDLEHYHVEKTEPRIISFNFGNLPGPVRPLLELPRNFNIGGASSYRDLERSLGSISLDHAFSDTITDKLTVFTHRSAQKLVNANAHSPIQADQQSINIQPRYIHNDNRGLAVRNDLLVQLETGPVKHKVLLGAEYTETKSIQRTFLGRLRPRAINIRQFNQLPDSAFELPPFPDPEYTFQAGQSGNGITDVQAGYLNDQISAFGEKLRIIAGLRYDRIGIEDRQRRLARSTTSQVSPQVSALYQVVPTVALFASYSTSLQPNAQDGNTGRLYDPQTGEGKEAGVKLNTADNRLSATVSLYEIERENIPFSANSFDANGNLVLVTFLSGLERSRGGELEVIYSPLENWQLIGGYAYTDAEIVKSTVSSTGTPTQFSTPHQFSLWNKYTITHGPLKNVSIGAGLVHIDDTSALRIGPAAGQTKDQILVWPAYTRLDLSLGYTRRVWGQRTEFALQVTNLTNEKYIEGEGYFGQPISLNASVKFSF